MAITTSVGICNLALAHLGEAPITSLSDDTPAAIACALHYEPTRDEVLRSHRWNFAQARVALVEDDDTPAFGWDHQFILPTDCLRVLEFNDSEAGDVVSEQYIIEGRLLLTDADSANLVYVSRVTDVTAYDPIFIQALAAKLALALSESLRGTTIKTEQMLALYDKVTAPLARRIDANEGRRRKGLIALNSMAIRARMGGAPDTTPTGRLIVMDIDGGTP